MGRGCASPLPAGTPEHLHLAINEVGEVILDSKAGVCLTRSCPNQVGDSRGVQQPILRKEGDNAQHGELAFFQRAQPWQTSTNQSTAPGAYPIVMPMSWLRRGQLPGRQEGYDGRYGAPRPDGVQAEALEIYRTTAPANASLREVQEPCGAGVPGGR